ncbi:Thiol-disulfide isomerase or thioredoxin [Candidatus Thermokryptus mobilis]|uniref:Thiol-disulfide isomerase or thioredoxin n=1 Tax=Candidatus Thermokryptus mobilis TaxID=1643428 RepID=A0A0S4NA60_9BACT|nr:thioredoxin family protein [Candidatus Thermokryptus mobilis]CUU08094.1 Thiol-disulfide isomerase or thioredoxin [Candidatus Thermokryptus mobilis]
MKRFLILIPLLLLSCSQSKYTVIEQNNVKIIIGEFPAKILESEDFKWYSLGYSNFVIEDTQSFNIIKSKANQFDVLIFLGTWCPDSREHVPKFMKIMDMAGVSRENIKFIGLDRDKTLKGLTDRYNIKRVPTFIFIKDGKEIGRIVENPEVSLTKHIAKILSQLP